jgi:hypothetical protein
MNHIDDDKDRPVAYPKPTETDLQLNNQPEYMDQQPNSLEKDISDLPESTLSGNSPAPERSDS